MLNNPMNAVTTKFVRTSTNKVKCPVFVIRVSSAVISCPPEGSLCLLFGSWDWPKQFWTPDRMFCFFSLSSCNYWDTETVLWNDFTLIGTIKQVLTLCLVLIQWTPEGRRLVTGASSGEFTLWNGLTFNFETILQVNASATSCSLPSWYRVKRDSSGWVQQYEQDANCHMTFGLCAVSF